MNGRESAQMYETLTRTQQTLCPGRTFLFFRTRL
jgi:hypothetical protein